MFPRPLPLLLFLLSTALVGAGAATQENAMTEPFVVVDHLTGRLAFPISEIDLAWRREAASDRPSSVRLVGAVLGEPKVLEADAADSLWATLTQGARASRFVLLSHQGGTLAVPRDQIRSAFLSTEGEARLRLVYEGEPSGKVVEGEEAERVWRALTSSP